MTIYQINPQSNVNSNNIINIMSQLILDIANSIKPIYNIVIESQYNLMINNISQILNNYLKIYYFYGFGIKNIYVQIYNQNINLVLFINIVIVPYKYNNITSNWIRFYNGGLSGEKYVYEQLTIEQKNELLYCIISNKLYFISNITFLLDNLTTHGIILKPIYNITCNCDNTISSYSSGTYCYITTLYWN